MIKNYFKIAFRNLLRNKAFSSINIAGLGIGIACSIMILLWVMDELSYDSFNKNANQLFRVVENQHYENGTDFPVAVTPGPLGPTMQGAFPEIMNTTRLMFSDAIFRYEDKLFHEYNIAFVDSSFFKMFSFPLIKGDASTVFKEPGSIVLTEAMAKKYFGEKDPLGKIILINNKENGKVSGVLADIPHQSHIKFDFLTSYHYAEKNFPWVATLDNNSIYTYSQLKNGILLRSFNKKIKDFLIKHSEQDQTDLYLQPLTAIHLHSNFTADIGGHGSMQYIYIFSIVALLVIIIACINFMNLSTAKYARRAKEVGIRKVIGAHKKNIIYQFLGESVFMSVLALFFALVLVIFFIPAFNKLSDKELSIASLSGSHITAILSIALLTGLISGTYPAFFLSSFQPIKVLKGIFIQGSKGISFRKVLVVVQFVISVVLIIGTLIIGKQLSFIKNKRLGFDKENIISILKSDGYENLKNELLQRPGIADVTMTNNSLTYVGNSSSGWEWEGKDPNKKILFHELAVDFDFTETFKMKILQGRSFSKQFITDTMGYIINEEALKQMKLKDPVGKKLSEGKIIGVVQDFNFKSIHNKIEPLILMCKPQWCQIIFVRLKANHIKDGLADVEKIWKRFNPATPYEYVFLDQQFNQLYQAEQRTGVLFKWFASLAIFISCLGLFGLVAYSAEQRTKEIGIRKVLGASVGGIVTLLSKDFLKLVLIAAIIAFPLAWWGINKWLQDFAYRIHISWLVFVFAGVLAFLIAIFTVSFQAIRAAIANPVKSLRTE